MASMGEREKQIAKDKQLVKRFEWWIGWVALSIFTLVLGIILGLNL